MSIDRGSPDDQVAWPEHVMQSAPGPETIIDGRPMLYFAGTGYLGLQGHPDVIRAGTEALAQFGVHSATSRSGFGNQPPTLEVERLAAQWMDADAAFYFISGYLGNHVLATALAERFDVALVDEHAHYSVREALRLAGLAVLEFHHGNASHLTEMLREKLKPGQRPLVASDGVFPVTGQIAPAADYFLAIESYDGAALMLDDAHAVGVLGENGRGTFEHFGLHDRWVNSLPDTDGTAPHGGPLRLMCGTLSKAVGGSGGIIAGTRALIGKLKSSSRYFDAASPPAAPVAGATAAALKLVLNYPDLRRRLGENVARLKRGLRGLGLDLPDVPTPIVGLVLGDAANMQRIWRALFERGIAIGYFRAYSAVGPEGTLRIAVFANHTPAMIDRLVTELAAVL